MTRTRQPALPPARPAIFAANLSFRHAVITFLLLLLLSRRTMAGRLNQEKRTLNMLASKRGEKRIIRGRRCSTRGDKWRNYFGYNSAVCVTRERPLLVACTLQYERMITPGVYRARRIFCLLSDRQWRPRCARGDSELVSA